MEPKGNLKIAVLGGDGIGMDVISATIPVFAALKIPTQLNFGDIGWSCWQKEGNPVPDRTWKLITESDSVLLGAITSKPQREAKQELAKNLQYDHLEYVSPLIQLRQKLDFFANIRPCFSIEPTKKEFNFCIIRENTEGLYSGFDYHPAPEPVLALLQEHSYWAKQQAQDMSCTLRLQSKTGLLRLFTYAFEYADRKGIKRVTFADKPNVLRHSSAFARNIYEEIAALYPHITADILNVDAVALWMIRRPEEFGVIVCENMFGDLLSDVAAGIMGGLGFAPSANIGPNGSYFEPVHGSGPRMKRNSANPAAMFLSVGLLLEHFAYYEEAQKIVNAIISVVSKKRYVTYDLGGKASTTEMASAIIDEL